MEDIARSEDFDFDLDIYKVVKKAITGSHKSSVLKLANHRRTIVSFDAID
jgi:DNA polymerase-3 subunit epsilon